MLPNMHVSWHEYVKVMPIVCCYTARRDVVLTATYKTPHWGRGVTIRWLSWRPLQRANDKKVAPGKINKLVTINQKDVIQTIRHYNYSTPTAIPVSPPHLQMPWRPTHVTMWDGTHIVNECRLKNPTTRYCMHTYGSACTILASCSYIPYHTPTNEADPTPRPALNCISPGLRCVMPPLETSTAIHPFSVAR